MYKCYFCEVDFGDLVPYFNQILGIIDSYGSVRSQIARPEQNHEDVFGFEGVFKRWRYIPGQGVLGSGLNRSYGKDLSEEDMIGIENHLYRLYDIEV